MVNTKYCVGCGLCEALGKAKLKERDNGFYYPIDGDEKWLKEICPIGNIPEEYYDKKTIWGKNKGIFWGWSTNALVRNAGSSGGVLTEIAMYLLENKIVNAIIHVHADPINPVRNISKISKSVDDILKGCGSRYSISHPLEVIGKLDKNEKYVFIGKPCDVVALRNFQKKFPEYFDIIPIVLSFFCMGLPSNNAQKSLLNAMNISINECQKLVYRGNGWPGYTTATKFNGDTCKLDYKTSWGSFLGRDVMPACRFCMDGLGEAADISCADGWFLDDNNYPDFSEHPGRNVVFVRSTTGKQILREMFDLNRISIEKIEHSEEYLKKIQYSQFYRRASMKYRILAIKFMKNKKEINYSKEMLSCYGNNLSLFEKIHAFFSTCKRIIKGRI